MTFDTEDGPTVEQATWQATVVVEKYDGDGAFDLDAEPYEVTEPIHNMLMTAGVSMLWQLVSGQGGASFSATNAYIGVGDSGTNAAATQTDLMASSNKVRKQVSGTPTISGNTITYSATFGTSDANFAWNEIGLFNNSSAGVMLNRFVSSLGTKSNTASWTINVSIAIS